ncbi:MAG TPA: AcvB/VirJ family lysyl-phosphatidylglycerol hydrolase, partial [Gemmatirosa sp.]
VAAAALVATYPLARQLIFPPAVPRYVPRDPLLRQMPVALFPVPTGRPARALILFFGNDIGFWRAHQELAERLAARGFDVVGVDVVKLLPTLPSTTPEVRDSAFAAYVRPLVRRVRREFGVLDVPLVVAGHSFGADIAIWTAAYAAPAGTVGVLAMGPGSRGHLGLSPINPLERLQNPTGPGTFSTADAVRAAAPWVRFAVVRGGGDLYAEADPALVAAGGARLHRTLVPLAGHAFRRLLIAGPLIERDVEWLLDSLAVRRPAMPPPAPARAPAS